MQPSGQNISFADGVHGQNHGLRRLTEYFVGVTTYLAGYSECEWAYFSGNVFLDTPFAYVEQTEKS